MKRSSGILLPVFSLPSPYGIGTLGKEAYNFIDFLQAAGQKYWQMLPLGPTGFGDSPYQSLSSFAGNPYFIDLNPLVEQGLLTRDEVDQTPWGQEPTDIGYQALYLNREGLLRTAFARFCYNEIKFSEGRTDEEIFGPFYQENRHWLEDYALYAAVKKHFQMRPWHQWDDEGIRLRRPEALKRYEEMLREDISYHIFTQYLFFTQWEALRDYGKAKGIDFIGDLPIYIAMDSADAWSARGCLQLTEEGKPMGVAGVPPDYFSETGQLWGNPLYDWDKVKEDGYAWWMERIRASARMFDIIRLDHFRGFESYWSVPFGELTAVGGKWMKGPGMDFIRMVKERFPSLEIIAEDLGILTEEVHRLVEDSGFPGMKVLQFAFGSGNRCGYLPHMYGNNAVVYTGTHDNTTVRGWLEEEATETERSYAVKYFGLSGEEGWNWGFIRGAMSSVADLCIVQMQDYLNLPGTARTNIPGTLGGNWQWRLTKDQLTEALAERIANICRLYNR